MKEVIASGLLVNVLHIIITIVLLGFSIVIFNRLLTLLDKKKYRKNSIKNFSTYSWLPEPIENWIVVTEKETNMKVVPYLLKYFCFALVAAVLIPIIAYITNQNVISYSVISVSFALFLLYTPYHTMKKMKIERRNRITAEVVHFKEEFATLMLQQTLHKTTMDSLHFAGPTIYPYVEKLILEVELFPNSDKPYLDMAKELGDPDLETFFHSMLDTVKIDPQKFKEVISEELKQNERLQESIIKETIDRIGSKIDSSNTALAIPILVIIMVFASYTIMSLIDNSGLFGNL